MWRNYSQYKESFLSTCSWVCGRWVWTTLCKNFVTVVGARPSWDGCCKNKRTLTNSLAGVAPAASPESLCDLTTWPRCSPQRIKPPLSKSWRFSFQLLLFWRWRESSECMVVFLQWIAWEISITVAGCLGRFMFFFPSLWREAECLAGDNYIISETPCSPFKQVLFAMIKTKPVLQMFFLWHWP